MNPATLVRPLPTHSTAGTRLARRAPTLISLFHLRHIAPLLILLWLQFLLPPAVQDPDLWWHMANAADALDHRSLLHPAFLRYDGFSFTAARAPWIDHEWLAELPLLLAWRLGSLAGLLLLTYSALAVLFLGVYWLTLRRARSHAVALAITLVAALLSTVSFAPRTLLAGWLCLVAELILFELFARHPRSILLLPFIFALWINLHGSWLIGLVLFTVLLLTGMRSFEHGSLYALAWTREHRRLLSVAFALSCAALLVNPYGWHLVAYPFDLAFHQPLNIANVEEWQPLNLASVRGLLLLGLSGLVFLLDLLQPAGRRVRWSLCELAFVLIGLVAACLHSRFLFLAAILALPILGGHLAHAAGWITTDILRTTPPRSRPLVNAALLIAMLLVVESQAMRRPLVQLAPTFPRRAQGFLKNFHPHGRLFNEYLWGGYLEYNDPQIPVFIDSRMDIFERNGTLRDYLAIIRLRQSLALLDQYRITYVLFERHAPLTYLLEQNHAWRTDYEDDTVVLLVRTTPLPPSPAFETHP